MSDLTSWGAPITYGWELEGSSTKVLNWFKPPDYLLKGQNWEKMSERERIEIYHEKKSEWDDYSVDWSTFEKFAGPEYVSEDLAQEVRRPVWEMKCAKHSYPNTLVDLTGQIQFLRTALDSNNVQVHFVFDRPNGEARLAYYRKIVGLFFLLNDYAAAKRYAHEPQKVFMPFVGAITSKAADLIDALDSNRPLERHMKDGIVGKYKFNFVGLRGPAGTAKDERDESLDLYGKNKIGIELRSGWDRGGDQPHFDRIVEKVSTALRTLDKPIHIKFQTDPSASTFTLEKHAQFHMDNPPRIEPLVQDYLSSQARLYSKKHKMSFWNRETTLPDRWAIAFIPWELHPVFENNPLKQSQIEIGRTKLTNRLIAAMTAGGDSVDAHDHIARFLNGTELYKYL